MTDTMKQELEAVAVFESQNIDVDYPRAIGALNASRSLAAGLSHRFAEAFFVETLGEPAALCRNGWQSPIPCAIRRLTVTE